MTDPDEHSAADAGETASPKAGNSKGTLKSELSRKQVLALLGLLLVVVAAVVLYREGRSWREASARAAVEQRDEPPRDWKGIPLGATRGEIAEMLVDAGAHWPSIQKPGTAPTEWAAHVNLEINGHSAKEFSVRFSDGQRWDYGRHPQVSSEVVDAETLIGGLDPQAELTGLMWMLDRSDADLEDETVPLEVLQELGRPHSEETDVTGFGRVYHWDWPAMKAHYTTIDGRLTIQLPEAVPT